MLAPLNLMMASNGDFVFVFNTKPDIAERYGFPFLVWKFVDLFSHFFENLEGAWIAEAGELTPCTDALVARFFRHDSPPPAEQDQTDH